MLPAIVLTVAEIRYKYLLSHPLKELRMHIGEPLRTIIVEPLELPVNDPTAEPVPEPQEPEPTQEPATV